MDAQWMPMVRNLSFNNILAVLGGLSYPCVDCSGTLIRSHDSDIPDNFVDGLVRVVQRVTPTGAAEFLLNELCKKGLFLPEDQPKKSHDGPDVDPQKWDQSGESPGKRCNAGMALV